MRKKKKKKSPVEDGYVGPRRGTGANTAIEL